jgi:hypothetical protein
MSDRSDIDQYVKDPSMLMELCREVIDELDERSDDTAVAEQEAQLRVIAKAVEQLEKSRVAVPDPLRSEKIRLATSLALHTDAKQALAQLADDFQDILTDLRKRLGQNTAAPSPSDAKPPAKRSKLPKTAQAALREEIVLALRRLGGKAKVADVIAEVGRSLEGKLLPGDSVWRETASEYVWQNNVRWERFQMTQAGVLRRGSPRGVWELEDGQQ